MEIIDPQFGTCHRSDHCSDQCSERSTLKRIRYINVVRYSRRVTVTQGAPAVTEMSTEQCADDLMLELLEELTPQPERVDDAGSAPDGTPADQPARRSRFKLRDLLRLRW